MSHDRLTRLVPADWSGPTLLEVAVRPRFVWEQGSLIRDDTVLPQPFAPAIEGRAGMFASQARNPIDGLSLVLLVWTNGTRRNPLGRRLWRRGGPAKDELALEWLSDARHRLRWRPGSEAHPAQVVDTITGALASSLAARQALVDQHKGCILATNALEEATLSPQAVLAGDKGQAQAERGCRLLKDPQCLAASLYLNKPERIMALLRVMTGCVLGYAALEHRLRQAPQTSQATFPNQTGQRVQNPMARWVFHDFIGIHLRCRPGQWSLVLNRTEEHQHRLQLLGKPSERWYHSIFTTMNEALRNVG